MIKIKLFKKKSSRETNLYVRTFSGTRICKLDSNMKDFKEKVLNMKW